MGEYMLAMHAVEGEPPRSERMSPEEMERSWKAIEALNAELQTAGAWVFGGALHAASAAMVVRSREGEVATTDGPFAGAKEQIAGFYIISAPDLDAALEWAAKASAAVGRPIELRPFREATGA